MSTGSFGLNQAFQGLMGRAPTDAEIIQFNRFAAALGLKENDAVYLLLFVYTKMSGDLAATAKAVETVPEKVKQEIGALHMAAVQAFNASMNGVIQDHKNELDAHVQSKRLEVEKVSIELDAALKNRRLDIEAEKATASKAIADTAVAMIQSIAGSAAAQARAKWTIGATLSLLVALAAIGGGAFYYGKQTGLNHGYALGKAETVTGMVESAGVLYRGGVLQSLGQCKGNGVRIDSHEGKPVCSVTGVRYYITR